MSTNSTERLLLAERQFTELANQLTKLKTAAQSIEQAGKSTGQMRELAETAILTAGELGRKIHDTAEILQKQNVPQYLREGEERQNTKFQNLTNQVANLTQESHSLLIQLNNITSTTKDGLKRIGDDLREQTNIMAITITKTQIPLTDGLNRLSAELQQHAAQSQSNFTHLNDGIEKLDTKTSTTLTHTQSTISTLKRIIIALSILQLGALGTLIYLISKR